MIAIFEQVLLAFPLVVGAYLSISLMKLPDLSIESAYLFGATLAITVQSLDIPMELKVPLTLLASLVGGSLVGLVTSSLNQLFRMPFLLSAIITNGLFHGLTQLALGKSLLSFESNFNPLTLIFLIPSHPELGILIIINSLFFFLMSCGLSSQLGLSYAIFGNNPHFFKHYNISTRFVVMTGICLADACAGLSGYLFAQSNGFVDLSMGYGVVLLCLTSLILGKMFISSSYPYLSIPGYGLLTYFMIQQFLLQVGLNLKYFNAFQAAFIMSILIFFYYKQPQKRHLIDHLGV